MHLLGQFYISLQVREGNAYSLFEVDNTDVPLSLSKHGNLMSGQKLDLVSCLEKHSTSDFDEAGVKLIENYLATTKHVVIWDQYLSVSLKVTTRQCRGARV